MSIKIICENEIENGNFILMSNDDKKQYQDLFVENDKMDEVIKITPCDYFTAVNAVMFSETLEEVKERFKGTWEEYDVAGYIDYITRTNGDD